MTSKSVVRVRNNGVMTISPEGRHYGQTNQGHYGSPARKHAGSVLHRDFAAALLRTIAKTAGENADFIHLRYVG